MRRIFTVKEANRAIKLIQPIVEDILRKMKEAQKNHVEVKNEREQIEVSETILMQKLSAAEKLLNEVEYHMKELESIGVFLKDLEVGLVDFSCFHRGREIFLCWMKGEEKVEYWHEISEGFDHRKPVDASFAVTAVA